MKKALLSANLSITFAFIITTTALFQNLNAQIVINGATPAQMVANLVGPGIIYSNVTYTGDAIASGTFTNGSTTNLGLNSGVILTSGDRNLVPVNNSGAQGFDNTGAAIPELNVIAGANTFDGAILEFDFIPLSPTLNVDYIFGSEEYLEWVNLGYNDAFAFYISGPGIVGQVNIATIAGQPVTIDNVNTTSNSAFFVNNTGSSGPLSIEYDGFTTQLTATRTVIPCSTYHIKLMIADGGDAIYDSGVFIEENGLYTQGNVTQVAVQPAYGFGSGIEGCLGSQFVFTMPFVSATNTTFNFTVGGTAIAGQDYVPIPNSITIPAGQTMGFLPVNIIDDGITEGAETITLTVNTSPCSTETFTLTIVDPTPLSVIASDATMCFGQGPVNISASPTGGDGIITYNWSNAATGTPISVNPATTTNYTVTATDQCGKTATDISTVTVVPLPTSTFTISPTTCTGNPATVTYTGNAGPGATYNWNFNGGTAVPGGNSPGPHAVTWNTAGNYNVTLNVVSACTSLVTTQPISVIQTPAAPILAANFAVCAGDVINLTSNTIAGATYVWSGPNGFTSNLEDPSIAGATAANSGTYSAYVVVLGCTSAVSNVNVTVNSIPAAPVVPAAFAVCAGDNISLSANTIAGATYYWTGPNGFSSNLEDPTVAAATAANAGTYNVYVTVNNCTSAVASVNVTVNPIPAAPILTANFAVCAGDVINLTANTIAGATYVWSGPNGFTSNLEDPSITGATAANSGTYSAYVVVLGCTSAVSNVNVTVNSIPAAPVVPAAFAVCAGDNISLSANTIAGATYYWTGPNGFSSNLEDPTVAAATAANAGTYNVYVTVNNCTSAVASVDVTVNPIPAAPILAANFAVCAGDVINLTSNTIAGATYVWSGPNGFTSNLEDPTVAAATAANSGTYNVYVTVNNCTSAVASVNVTVNPIPAAPILAANFAVCAGDVINLTANTIAGATYVWSGPNGFTSNLEDPSIAGATAANSGTYSAYVVVLGCTSAVSNVNVTVNSIPAAPVVPAAFAVCAGDNISLSANTIAGATYYWTGPNGFSSNLEDPSVAAATAANSGTYNVYVTVNNCTSAVASVDVTVNPIPAAPILTANFAVCAGDVINLTANTIAGATYVWSGPNGFTSNLEDPSIAGATAANSGTYSAYVVVLGCTSAVSNVNVTVNSIPAAPVVPAAFAVCAGDNISLSANTIAGATYYWTGPNGFSSNLEDPTVAAATAANAGTYNVYVTVNNCTSAVASVNVTVNPIPAAPILTANFAVCAGDVINLTANTIAGATYVWSGPNGFTSNLEDPSITGATAANSGTYSAYVVVLGCTSAVSNVNVTVNSIPAAPVVPAAFAVCAGDNISLSANTIAGATYYWTGPNGFSSNLEDPSVAAATAANSGTYNVYVTVNNCTSAVASVNVTVNPIPAAPILAANFAVCAGDVINLTANTIAGATYVWSGPNGFTSNLEDPSITGATAANSGTYSAYVVVLGCTSAVSNVNVTVNSIPAAPVVPAAFAVCAGDNISLSANTIAGATYYWTGPNGFSSNLEDPTVAAATAANAGTYNVYVTVNNCTSAVASVNVTVNPIPAAPILAANFAVCAGDVINLTSNTIAGATYVWSGPNGFTSNLEDPSIAGATAANSGTYSAYVVVLGCTSAVSNVNVTVNSIPAAPVVPAAFAVCAGDNISLSANTIAGATYYWTGPNGFSSNLEDPTVAAATAANAGTYNVYVTVNNCTSAVASVNVTVNPIPAAPILAANFAVCAGDVINLTSNTIAGATYVWSGPNGFTSNLEDPSIAGATAANSGTYSAYVVVLGCTSAVSNVNVTVNSIPAAPVVPAAFAVCAGDNISLSANTIAGATYYWTGPNGFSSNLEDPSVAAATAANSGTYNVYVTVNNCTSAVASVNVTVNPIPAAPILAANFAVCAGDVINLTANTIAGATYVWSGPNGFTSNLEDPSIANATVGMTGNYSAYVVVLGCTSAVSVTTVTVNPLPDFVVIPGGMPVCEGETINLTMMNIPGASYTWDGPNGFTSNVEDPSIPNATLAMSGAYNTYVSINGCSSLANITNVVVNPLPAAPVVNSNSPVCESTAINLTASNVAGASYTWTGPNGFTSNNQNPSIASAALANAGAYNAYITVNGCSSSTAVTNVVVNATPITPVINSNSPVCENGTITLTANTVVGASYTWSGPNGFSSNVEDPSISPATLATGGTYNAYITVAGCSSATASTQVSVTSLPVTPILDANSPVCEGATLNLSATNAGAANTIWSGPNGFSANTANASVTPAALADAGVYTAYLVASGCTSATANINVAVTATPSGNFAVTPQICLGADGFALYNGNAAANATYTWTASNGATITGTGQGPITFNWAAGGAQDVTLVVTQNGCSSNPNTQPVNVIAPVIPDAGPDQTVCSGAQINVGAQNQPAANYTWLTPNGLTNPASEYSSASWVNNGNGTITINLSLEAETQGCTATDEAIITVVPNPTASINGPITQCFSENSVNFVAGGNYMPQATFAWTFANSATATSTQQNPTGIQFLGAGTHDVSLVVTQMGCSSAPAQTTVTLNPGPSPAFSYLPGIGCIPLEVAFTNQTVPGGAGVTYVWNFGNGATSDQTSPVYTYTEAGIYSVSLTATDAFGCSATNTQANIIRVYDEPVAGFAVSPQTMYIDEPVTNVYDGALGGIVAWNYTVSNGANFNVPDFTINFADTGTYEITQVVTSEYGCTATMVLEVQVLPVSDIFIPNAFTPNSNDELNSIFKPIGTNVKDFKMYIFNRWGEIVFTSIDINEGWNGRVRNSDVEAKQDLYVYRVDYTDHRGNEQQKLGNVVLIR